MFVVLAVSIAVSIVERLMCPVVLTSKHLRSVSVVIGLLGIGVTYLFLSAIPPYQWRGSPPPLLPLLIWNASPSVSLIAVNLLNLPRREARIILSGVIITTVTRVLTLSSDLASDVSIMDPIHFSVYIVPLILWLPVFITLIVAGVSCMCRGLSKSVESNAPENYLP